MAFLNLLGSILVQRHGESLGSKRVFLPLAGIVLVIGVTWAALGGMTELREYSLSRLWNGYHVLGSRDSVYGNIVVTERGDQRSFFDNGLHLYTVPDRLSAEESVHFALLGHKDPKDVLLIGGGVGGMLEEILKHPVKRIDYIELDPTIIAMAREYLSKEDSAFLDRAEVNVVNEDGRYYVKRTRRSYDCVMIHLGDPYTAQINRFYTLEFFRELSGILNDGGVVSLGLTSSENYIGEELGDYLASIYRSVNAVFPEVLIVPGDTVFFLASNRVGAITADIGVLADRIKKRNIDVKYVRKYYLSSKLSSQRVEYAEEAIQGNKRVSRNRDFKPVSYYYATVFWGTHFDAPFFQGFMRSVTPGNIWLLVALFCLLVLVLGLSGRRRRTKRAVLVAVMTTGFAEINFQIAVILSFQAIYGYVFYKLGIIITSFMVGLALGGWIIARYMPRIKNDMTVFWVTQLSICLYPLILPVVFLWLSGARSDAVSWMGANVVYPFLPVVAGIIGGIQFPLANKIYLEKNEQLGRVAGLTYGLDLMGACIGSLLAAAFLVPVIGIFQTCFLVAVINAAVLAVLFMGKRS